MLVRRRVSVINRKIQQRLVRHAILRRNLKRDAPQDRQVKPQRVLPLKVNALAARAFPRAWCETLACEGFCYRDQLHYHINHHRGKLIGFLQGVVFHMAIEINNKSPSFGKHVDLKISAEKKRVLWIPEVFAHGFVVLSETADFLYKSMDYYVAEHKRFIVWNDLVLNTHWAGGLVPALLTKDLQGKPFTYPEVFA